MWAFGSLRVQSIVQNQTQSLHSFLLTQFAKVSRLGFYGRYYFNMISKYSLPIDLLNGKNEFTFTLPLLGSFQCRINKNESNKIEISFSNPILNGINTWAILPCENEIVIENTLEIDEGSIYLKLLWLLLGNSLLRMELDNWNKRLKDIVEKTNLYKDVFQTA